jgi:hypothetical protein
MATEKTSGSGRSTCSQVEPASWLRKAPRPRVPTSTCSLRAATHCGRTPSSTREAIHERPGRSTRTTLSRVQTKIVIGRLTG